MATHVGIGFSNHIDAAKAAREAAFQSKSNLAATRVDAAIVFSTVHYDALATAPVVCEVLNNAPLIGCSTTGIILSKSIETRGIGVLTLTSDEIKFGMGSVENLHTRAPQEAGMQLAQNCLKEFGKHGRHVFLFFVDSRLKNLSPFLKSMQGILGNVFPIIGAGSCADFQSANTFQVHQNLVLQNAATGIIMGGNMSVGVSNQHGWRPLGKPRLIDAAHDNVIQSIDRKWAYSIYEEYFGDDARGLRASQLGRMALLYPLGILLEGSKDYLLRNAVDIQKDGSIVCQGDIPQGTEVHLMIGNKESCQQAARRAAEEAKENLLGKEAKLVIILESMARLKLLGRIAYQEILKIREVFGFKVPIIGMYANGEICPLQSVERFKSPHLQNESIVVLAIS